MPTDMDKLSQVLSEMKKIYIDDPEKAVRSKKFIMELQQFCSEELNRLISEKMKNKGVSTTLETDILTSHKTKNVDVTTAMQNNGPLMTISIKSQMSSIAKNMIGYYETIIGDVTGLHERFPFLVAGMFYLFPLKPILDGHSDENPNFAKFEQMFKSIIDRKEWDERTSKYEQFAMLVVDFDKDPPEVVKDIPKNNSLRVENFFDNMINSYNDRVPYSPLTE